MKWFRCSLRDTGIFYVIEGFLDVILPIKDLQRRAESDTKTSSQDNLPPDHTRRQPTSNHGTGGSEPLEEGKHLFTVKPGGIAGYLGKNACRLQLGPPLTPSSIIVQHGLVRRHQGKDGYMCGVPPAPCLGTVVGKTSNCPPDARQETYFPSFSTRRVFPLDISSCF